MLRKLHYPLLAAFAALCLSIPIMGVEFEASTGELSPDGYPANADLPKALRKKNISSPPNSPWGGCCVFRSIDHTAHWQDIPQLNGFPEWMVKNKVPGGGYPSKVDNLIPQICKDRNAEIPRYIQIESNDLKILKLACKTRRMVCVTYAFSPTGRYSGKRIAHMVNLVHADEKWFAILDNNYIEELEWMTPQEFLPVYHGGKTGWCIIFLDYPPPPIPRNRGE